ncbi:LPD28 domain-containing protein [Seleniivibrio woodruffii]|uniref:Large polyvalent protein associated domain-containing protein n=1 Tax=Seleniivibrio woodruffii TaxID=1078050 RepID=A0A4R1K3E9_9BACT|nr:LPD28 domain-containing protein [Seleniivibrio woodruffii]TCK58420.1 hypothetical protein C8D98_2622 [Seleniivibrio woodruffii]TVZ36793.1 hypothetical protein OF66_2431 [Seleniivibrio woodruffii]
MFNNLYAYYDGRLKSAEKEQIEKLAGRQLFFYETRHDDDGDWVTPVTIEKSVFVNFCNTVIFIKPLQFGDADFIEIDEEDWDFDFPQIVARGNEFVLSEKDGAYYE